MPYPEILNSNEQLHSIDPNPIKSTIPGYDFPTVLENRRMQFHSIENLISKKLLYFLEEKIEKEKLEIDRILGLSKKRKELQAKYTNILDTAYFEQKFLH